MLYTPTIHKQINKCVLVFHIFPPLPVVMHKCFCLKQNLLARVGNFLYFPQGSILSGPIFVVRTLLEYLEHCIIIRV